MSLSKKLITGFIGLTILGLLALALMPSPVPVSATLVRQDVFVESIEDEGRTRLRDIYTVFAPIDGYLRRVTLEPGDTVAADQVLFELEPLPAPALYARSRGQAREALAAAQAHLEEAEANLSARQTEYELTQRHRCCEGPAQSGETVLEIGDLDALEVKVDLLSVDAVRVRPEMRVILERWGGEDALEGRVRLVEPAGSSSSSGSRAQSMRFSPCARRRVRSPGWWAWWPSPGWAFRSTGSSAVGGSRPIRA